MKQLTLTKVNQLGDVHPEYGASFWCEVKEQLEPVMFNLKDRTVQEGDVITAEEVLLKTSAKGQEYHRLKKVKINEGDSTTTQPLPSTGIESKLDELLTLGRENNAFMRMLLGDKVKKPDEIVPVDDTPINLDDIPFK